MIEQIIEHWDDIGVTVVFTQRYEYCIEFRAVEIVATNITGPGVQEIRGWTRKGADTNLDLVYDPLLAERYVGGGIKWDGCSNLYFGAENDDGYLHICGPEGIQRMSSLLVRVFNRCGELLGDTALKSIFLAAEVKS